MRTRNVLTLFLILYNTLLYAQISLIQFSTGYNAPVDIKNAGDDRLFIVEQGGYIRIADTAGNKYPQPFLDIHNNVIAGGERGLLGLAFDPDYKNNGFFYVNYTAPPNSYTRISRFQVSSNPDSAIAGSEQVLLTIYQPFLNHKGGGINFSPKDGYLYIGMGDGGSFGDPANRAQNLDSLLGKMLRIDVRGGGAYSIPPDNPFVGKPGRDEIWASGLRNPWRWSFDRWTHDLWIGDVGQGLYEEIDYQMSSSSGGENYGWRCYEGNNNYNITGCGAISNYVFPVYEYSHSGFAAVIGGYVYRGAEYENMFGQYFFTDQYTSTASYGFKTLTPDGSGGFATTALGALGRTTVVTFGEDRWGELYVADAANGTIYKFQGAACQPAAFIFPDDSIYLCPPNPFPYLLTSLEGKGFHYQWYLNGSPIAGNDNDSLLAVQPGRYSLQVTNRFGCSATSFPTILIYPCVGIEEESAFGGVSLFPSPNSGDFTVSFYLAHYQKINFQVIDVMGKIVYDKNEFYNSGSNSIELHLSELAKGVYSLRIITANRNIQKLFVLGY